MGNTCITIQTQLLRIPITIDPYFRKEGQPEVVIESHVIDFDVALNGQKIIVVSAPASQELNSRTQFTVITNWSNKLSRIAPVIQE